jgi:hypothetical protein
MEGAPGKCSGDTILSMSTLAVDRRGPSAPRVVWCERSLGILEVERICVVVWRENVTAERFRRQEVALDEVVHRYAGRAGFMCVVEAGTAPPDDRLRGASAEMINSHGNRLACLACVIEGSGFRAALTRSTLSGIALLLARRETKFTATVSAAAGWMAARGNLESPTVLIEACAALRERMANS